MNRPRLRRGAMPGFWVRDAMYMPRPVTPLTATTMIPAAEQGIAHGLSLMGGPGHLISLRIEHGYLYYGFRDTLPPMAMPTAEALERTRQGFFALPGRWDGEVLPRVKAMHAELRALAPPGVAPAQAAQDARRAQALLEENLRMHFELFQPFGGGLFMLQHLMQQAGVPGAQQALTAMIAGLPNEINLIDADLLHLGALVEDDPRLHQFVIGGDAKGLVHALGKDKGPAGKAFAKVWPRVFERPHTFDLGTPTWGEDPTPLLRAVAGGKAALRQAEDARAGVAARRASTEATVRRHIPAAQVPAFDAMLTGARNAAHLHQTHHYWMDELTPALCRLAFLRCAAPLVGGHGLAAAEDVAYLTLGELLGALEGQAIGKQVVEQRKWDRAIAFKTTPPPTLGEATPEMQANPVFVGLYGFQAGPEAASDTLKGMPGSPGKVRGPARVVHREEDLDHLRQGEVLVATTTDPAWTAVMGRAAAMVTETGGMLSHAAVVARERGVPAVVGARKACARIRTGQVVEVDGDEGVVTLLDG